jgi:hypothetical protein
MTSGARFHTERTVEPSRTGHFTITSQLAQPTRPARQPAIARARYGLTALRPDAFAAYIWRSARSKSTCSSASP